MDAILPILPSANTGATTNPADKGMSGPDAAEVSVFAGLVAAVTPVAPVAPRLSNGSAAQSTPAPGGVTIAQSTTSAASPTQMGTSLAQAPKQPLAGPDSAKVRLQDGSPGLPIATHLQPSANGSAGPVIDTVISTGTPHDTRTVVTLPTGTPYDTRSGAVMSTGTPYDTVSPPVMTPGTPYDTRSAGVIPTGTPYETRTAGNAADVSAKHTATAKLAVPAVPNAPDSASASLILNSRPETAAADTPASQANTKAAVTTMATAQAGTLPVTAAAIVPPAAPEAGVQARRQAQGEPLSLQSNTKTGAVGSTVIQTPSPANLPKAGIPQNSQPAPPPVPPAPSEAPLDQARPIAPDPGRLAPAPQALTDPGVSDTPAEQDNIDLSVLRAAETSRAAERPGTAAGTARFTPANAGTLAAQISAKFQNGERRFEIRMDPPELGRVEVRLQVGNDNRVQAMLSAERPETLNDMRQYARELERALEEAGLQLDSDGLSFELTQDQDPDDPNPGFSGFSELEFAEDLNGPVMAAAPPAELYGFRLSARSGVDVRL